MTEYASCRDRVEAEAPKFLEELSALSAKYGLVLVGDITVGIDECAEVGAYELDGGANGRVVHR